MTTATITELTSTQWLNAFVDAAETKLGTYEAAVEYVFSYFAETYLNGEIDGDLENDPWALQAYAAAVVLDDEQLAAAGLI